MNWIEAIKKIRMAQENKHFHRLTGPLFRLHSSAAP